MAMETSGTGNLRRNGKSRSAYRTISEVSNEIDVPAHVLRFWETKFLQIKPLKRGGGRRYYRPEDTERNLLPEAPKIEKGSFATQNKTEIKQIMEELKALKRLLSEL